MLLGVSKYGIKLAINVMLELAPLGEAGQAVSAWITYRGRTRVRLAKLYIYMHIFISIRVEQLGALMGLVLVFWIFIGLHTYTICVEV